MLTVGLLALSVAALATTWGVVLNRLESEEALLLQAATRQQESVALIAAENLSQVLDRGRLMALTAADALADGRTEAARKLNGMLAVDSAYLRVSLFDRRQRRVFTSSWSDEPSAIRKAIGEMVDSRSGTAVAVRLVPAGNAEFAWQVPVLFPVGKAGNDGRQDGVLLTVLDLGYLLGLYRNIDIGRSGRIHVLADDGRPLAEMDRAGLVLDPPAIGQRGAGGAGAVPVTRIDSPSAAGGERLVSYHPVERFPLLVAVSRDVAELRAARADAHLWIKRTLIGLSVAIALAVLWAAFNMRRQYQLLESLKKANCGNRALIGKLEEEKRRAFQLAAHDHLTGLHNRRLFNELVASHLAIAKRSHKHYALMYLDLDRFKGINDTLGHHIGDMLLKTISNRLRDALRDSDVIARLGGDEFAVLATGLDSIDDAALIAAKLVAVVCEPCTNLDGHDLQVGASIGIAIFPRDGRNADMLCRHADAAMYESKRAGRGCFTFYDAALNPAGEWQFSVEQRLPRAIADGELVLHFQPKVRLPDFRITGLEALVRWQHPEHGLIYPKDFITIAESSGHIVELGKWVAEACCRQLAAWRAEGLATVPIAFNVSARQLLDAHLPSFIASTLAAHEIEGTLLEIEITETALVDSIEAAGIALAALEDLGLRIALDDFGNGFSNLSYIRSLPIHALKIDRSFVSDLRNRPDDAVIVDSIVSLAHNLKMKVIAEGVESLGQIIHLKAAGCDEIQGYCLSRPVPADAARALVARAILEPV